MTSYLFDVTLLTSIRVDANSATEARRILSDALDGAQINAGAFPDGSPIVAEVSVEGELDLIDVDGEEPSEADQWNDAELALFSAMQTAPLEFNRLPVIERLNRLNGVINQQLSVALQRLTKDTASVMVDMNAHGLGIVHVGVDLGHEVQAERIAFEDFIAMPQEKTDD